MTQDLNFYFEDISFTDTKELEEVFENLYNDGWKIFEDYFVDKHDLPWGFSDIKIDSSINTFIAIKAGYKLYLEIRELQDHLKEFNRKSLKQSNEQHVDEQVSVEKPEQVSVEIPVKDTIKREYISFRKSKFVKIV